MRIYYIFSVKDDFYSLYKDMPQTLFNLYSQIYYMRKEDVQFGYNLMIESTKRMDKSKIDNKLFLELHNKIKYSKKDNTHIINNLYKNEVSVLKVKNSYILINSNKSCTEFFDILEKINDNFFVCDFINRDFFFLSSIKSLV